MRVAILILLLVCGFSVKAQFSYPEADSISFDLYQRKAWKELLKFSDQLNADSIEFYYLDLRKGIASYELGKWEESIRCFKEAMLKNPGSEVAALYLFKLYQSRGFRTEADAMFQLLSPEQKLELDYSSKNLLSSLFVESGLKVTSDKSVADNNHYGYLGMSHVFSPAFRIAHSLNRFEQQLNWSKFQQVQYSITPYMYLGKGWDISLNTGLIQFKRQLFASSSNSDLILRQQIQTPFGNSIKDSTFVSSLELSGEEHVFTSDFHLNLLKQWREFSFNLQSVYYSDYISPDYYSYSTEIYRTIISHSNGLVNIIDDAEYDSVKVSEKSVLRQFQLGSGLDYTLRFGKYYSLRAGVEFQFVLQDKEEHWVVLPFMEWVQLDKFSFFVYYFKKGFYPVSAFGGSTLFNTYDQINSRINLTGGIKLNRSTSVLLTYQHDSVTDAFSGADYKFDSGYIGIYIKL